MPRYIRAKGSVFFFTVVLAERPSRLLLEKIERLRQTYRVVQQRRPFETVAVCVLPDHIHAIWALPEGDADFSTRWSLIKSGFSRGSDSKPRSASKVGKREKGIWQRRYWEHAIRDDADLERVRGQRLTGRRRQQAQRGRAEKPRQGPGHGRSGWFCHIVSLHSD